MRELIILTVGLAVVAVILRGLFLALQARRGQIRLAIDKNIPQDVDLDELEMAELPSGGARVVRRSLDEVNRQNSTQDELDLGGNVEKSGPVPMLMDTVEFGKAEVDRDDPQDEELSEYISEESYFGTTETYQEVSQDLIAELSVESRQEDDGDSDASNEHHSQAQRHVTQSSDYEDDDDLFDFEQGHKEATRREPDLGLDGDFDEEFESFPMRAGDRIGAHESTQQAIKTGLKPVVKDESRQPGSRVSRSNEITENTAHRRRDDSRVDTAGNWKKSESTKRENATSVEEVTISRERRNSGEVASLSEAKEARRPGVTNATVNTPRQIETSEVLVINVMSRQGELFYGNDLMQVLLTAGLKHGDMNIFHKHVDFAPGSAIIYSVANILNPGTFELESMDNFSTRGVSLFMSMPAVISNLDAFEQMLKTALQIRGALNGELRDDHRNMMTAQTIEHYRQRVNDFEIRRLRSIQAQS